MCISQGRRNVKAPNLSFVFSAETVTAWHDQCKHKARTSLTNTHTHKHGGCNGLQAATQVAASLGHQSPGQPKRTTGLAPRQSRARRAPTMLALASRESHSHPSDSEARQEEPNNTAPLCKAMRPCRGVRLYVCICMCIYINLKHEFHDFPKQQGVHKTTNNMILAWEYAHAA